MEGIDLIPREPKVTINYNAGDAISGVELASGSGGPLLAVMATLGIGDRKNLITSAERPPSSTAPFPYLNMEKCRHCRHFHCDSIS